jgi:hypothetical protein
VRSTVEPGRCAKLTGPHEFTSDHTAEERSSEPLATGVISPREIVFDNLQLFLPGKFFQVLNTK